VFWDAHAIGNPAKEFQQFVYGVLGGTMAGWGILIAFVTRYPFRNKEKWAWNSMVASILVWFVLDTYSSIYFKVYLNAISNTALLILVALPIIFSRKNFA
jgi:hypothetical protein